MAGGSGRDRQGGRIEKGSLQSYRYRFYPCCTSDRPITENFKRRHQIETVQIRLRNINVLQENIQRIFTESLHFDLQILIGSNIISTNRCIVEARSPRFYDVLQPYFVYDSRSIKCVLNAPGIFRDVEHFVRLLYSNVDLSREEVLLVDLILRVSYLAESQHQNLIDDAASSIYSKVNFKKIGSAPIPPSKLWDDSYTECNIGVSKSDATVDISPASNSDMADSGLETGSVSPRDNSVSETSGVDLDESQATGDFSTDEDSNKVTLRAEDAEGRNNLNKNEQRTNLINFSDTEIAKHLATRNHTSDLIDTDATCSFVPVDQLQVCNARELDSSGSSDENAQKLKDQADEILRYETQVLDDPFCESDSDSDGNEQTNSFVPTESFEFIDPSSVSIANNDLENTKSLEKYESFSKEEDEKLNPNPEARSMTMEELRHELSHSNDLPIKKSSSSTSSYYFIDASSLNDEAEVPILESTSRDRDAGNRFASYIPSSSDCSSDDRPKHGCRKTASFQSGHEKVAEFEKELKLTESFEPFTELRKIKRLDSMSEDKIEEEQSFEQGKSAEKQGRGTEKDGTHAEKETLVVEIKEADSGDSARASPCPDNSKGIGNNRPHRCDELVANQDAPANSNLNDSVDNKTGNTNDEPRRPPLIRRNTFELDANEEKLSALRQEYERRQGNLVFQNSIPQYSGHRVDGDSCFVPPITTSHLSMAESWQNSPCLSIATSNVLAVNVNGLPSSLIVDNIEKNIIEACEVANQYPNTVDNCHDRGKEIASRVEQPTTEKETRRQVTTASAKPIEIPKRSKCNETTPIVSGGAVVTDYTKIPDSPIVRRKTESTPIVSGGSVLMEEPATKAKSAKLSTSMTSWVVDMSQPMKEWSSLEADTNREIMSQSLSVVEVPRTNLRHSGPEKYGSLGFFVNLDEATPTNSSKTEQVEATKEPTSNGKQYCEFFIDMSSSKEPSKPKEIQGSETSCRMTQSVGGGEKKNMFSMFIDLSDTKSGSSNKSNANALSSREEDDAESTFSKSERFQATNNKATVNSHSDENGSSSDKDQCSSDRIGCREANKQSIFMFIESDSPVVRRRTMSSSRPPFQRHSWNLEKGNSSSNGNGHSSKETSYRREHKRAHSLSVDRGDLRKNQPKNSNSSHSLSEAARADTLNGVNGKRLPEKGDGRNMDTSSEDVFEYDIRDTPPNSHIEIYNDEFRSSIKHHEYKELTSTEIAENFDGEIKANEEEFSEVSVWDKTESFGKESTDGPDHTRKSETFDISSGSSSGPSPRSDNHDSELSEMMNGSVSRQPAIRKSQNAHSSGHKMSETQKSLNEKIKKIECELTNHECDDDALRNSKAAKKEEKLTQDAKGNKSAPSNASGSSFVRLSDLDKAPVRFHASDVIATEDRNAYRMSSSIPETSWIESKLAMNRSTGPLRSRKFPSAMTTSLPPKQKSPIDDLAVDGDAEGVISESDLSSMQSSMGRSGAEGSTEETETSSLAGAKPYNRLGEDLLRMFLEEINPDVTIDVSGRRIRAHKCILSSRCQYFAAILSGGWVESAGNVIALQGYSYNSVHFALCHIYSGESNIPDTISIVELATLADMLCLEGLKEVISYTLKVKYCHLFHKPCQICAVGVLECMPLAAAYGLDEVYRKSLRWITRHFVRIWPCKAFATLPRELMDKCYHQHIVHMSTDNVLQTMMDCDKLLATLPNVRWAEPVFRLVSNLLETTVKYLSDNFSGLLGSEKFHALGREFSWNISRLEDNILAAADRLPPEQACKSYSKLHRMVVAAESEDPTVEPKWSQLFVEFLKKIHSHVEKCLVREAPRAARSTIWLKMDLELRRRIQELSCLVILPHEVSKRQSRHSNFLKEPRATSARSSTSRSLDLKKVKMVITEHNDRTSKQVSGPQTKKIPISKPKSDLVERKVQPDKQLASDVVSRPKSWPNKIEVKARYLEPRNKSVTKEIPLQQLPDKMTQQRRKIMISSSDSSRNSSPAMKRAVEKKTFAKMKLPIKKDAKALSSDSLADSNADKSGANKKDATSKSCGITRPESPSMKQKSTEIGLSVDSLAEAKKKPVTKKKPPNMDASMSTDSLMTEISATPKTSFSNKLSPTLTNRTANRCQTSDKAKKMSPPTQQKNLLAIARKPARSIECSTAASRNRALPITPYHGSPNLRRNLLDAAKTPDIPNKQSVMARSTTKQSTPPLASVGNGRIEKRGTLSNQGSTESPSRRSPKSNGPPRTNRSAIQVNKKATSCKTTDERGKTTKCHNGETTVKQPTVGSRSGTFLKDEPTILKKSDIRSSEANI